jgi:hypothetical protein
MSWLFEGAERELLSVSDREFIAIWSALFGGPPAALIARADMIALMREAIAPRRPPGRIAAARLGPDPRIREARGFRRSEAPSRPSWPET